MIYNSAGKAHVRVGVTLVELCVEKEGACCGSMWSCREEELEADSGVRKMELVEAETWRIGETKGECGWNNLVVTCGGDGTDEGVGGGVWKWS